MVKENTLERLKYHLDDHTNPELAKAATRGAFLGFRRGRILHADQQYRKIRTDRISTLSQNFRVELRPTTSTTSSSGNACPSMQSRVSVIAHGRHRVSAPGSDSESPSVSSSVSVNGDGSLSARLAPDYLVTVPCLHGHQNDDAPQWNHETNPSLSFIRSVSTGLFFDDNNNNSLNNSNWHDPPPPRRGKGANIFYQLTSENRLAQWLALQWQPVSSSDASRCLRIMQRECCFRCLLRRLEGVLSEMPEPSFEYPVCVIAAKEEC